MNLIDFKPSMGALRTGTHACLIYETEQEHEAVVSRFLFEGLVQNEQVLCILHEHSEEEILSYLNEYDMNVDLYLKRNQLVLLAAEQTYLQRGNFDKDRMCNVLCSMIRDACLGGFRGVRITGEMSWALQGFPGSHQLIEYEAQVTDLAKTKKCRCLCQYNRKIFPAPVLLHILSTHPTVVNGRSFSVNPYFMVPSVLVGQESASDSLNTWLALVGPDEIV